MRQTITTLVQGGTLEGAERPKDCAVDTPFFSASRTFERNGGFIKFVEKIEIKTALIPVSDMHGTQVKEAKEKLDKCWTETPLVFKNDTLVNPRFAFKHTRPWTLGMLQLEAEKLKRKTTKLLSKLSGRNPNPLVLSYYSIAPDWEKGKTIDQFKVKAQELIETPGAGKLQALLAKHLLLVAIEKNPEDPELYALLGAAEGTATVAAAERSKWDVYTSLELDPRDPAANRELARYMTDGGKSSPEDVLAEAKYALSLEPTSERGKTTLAWAYFKTKEYKKALETLGNVEDFGLREAIYKEMQDLDKLAETFEAELKKKPSYAAYVAYAGLLSDRGDADKAVELAKHALELKDAPEVHKIISDAYVRKASHAMEKTGKAEDAMEWLARALAEDNTNILAHQLVGGILIKRAREAKDNAMAALAEEHLTIASQLQKESERAPAATGR
jgi:tetratricopeptide (TPR) repeat protein